MAIGIAFGSRVRRRPEWCNNIVCRSDNTQPWSFWTCLDGETPECIFFVWAPESGEASKLSLWHQWANILEEVVVRFVRVLEVIDITRLFPVFNLYGPSREQWCRKQNGPNLACNFRQLQIVCGKNGSLIILYFASLYVFFQSNLIT